MSAIANTPLIELCSRRTIELLAAEDLALRKIWSYYIIPDFLDEGEQRLIDEWLRIRSEWAEDIVRFVNETLDGFRKLGDTEYEYRRRLRLSAMRRIDASFEKNERFQGVATLGTIPYFQVDVDGLSGSIRLGKVRTAGYSEETTKMATIKACIFDTHAIVGVENAILPFEDNGTPDSTWSTELTLWRESKAFREFEETSPFPAFPEHLVIDPNRIPEGLRLRHCLRNVESGIDYDLVCRLGFSLVLSDPGYEFCHKIRAELEELATPENAIFVMEQRINGHSLFEESV